MEQAAGAGAGTEGASVAANNGSGMSWKDLSLSLEKARKEALERQARQPAATLYEYLQCGSMDFVKGNKVVPTVNSYTCLVCLI